MQLIEALQWRYATKKFDNTKKVSKTNIDIIEEATRLSASSYGFQPYTVLKIEDPAIRKQLQPASWNQTQIVDASDLYVFCNFLDFTNEMIDEYVARKAKTQNISLESLDAYKSFMKTKLQEMSKDVMPHWTAKQAYIAMGNMLTACAMLKVDACPIEGFEPAKYDEILNLKNQGLSASVVVVIGYHAQEDYNFGAIKVRKDHKVLFKTI